MHEELVVQERWLSDDEFAHALSVCSMLPGPEAQQLVTYIGWRRRGALGGLIAGSLFVLPGFVALLVLSLAYVQWTESDLLQNAITSVSPAVVVMIAVSVIRLARRTLTNATLISVAVTTLSFLLVTRIPLPVILAGAFITGLLSQRNRSEVSHEITRDAPHRPHLRMVTLLIAAWPVPALLCLLVVDPDHAIIDTARFFALTAVTTFGGAYAILSYVADQAVNTRGWLSQRDMVAGLAMAETTPGPLIMVVQFVGFMAAYSAPGDLPPILAGLIASVVVTWVTFVPSIAVIMSAAPRVEWLRRSPRFQRATAGCIAVAIGGIADLGLSFASHVLFDQHSVRSTSIFELETPDLTTLDLGAFGLLIIAGLLVARAKWTTTRTMMMCLVIGLAGHALFATF